MIIGITGGIGSGKSTIARELAKLGFTVYDCDREAKRIIEEDGDVKHTIIGLLGEEAYSGGRYNTAYVAQRVFADKHLLAQLNSIVHPAVKEDVIQKQPDFVESAILYESGMDKVCDKIIVIDAPEEIRIMRTIQRDYHGNASEENINKVRARIRAQHATVHYPQSDRGHLLSICNDGKTSISDLVSKITHWM